eukprot:363062-Chlamydomonas_euryale.AAC.12
MYVRLDRCKRQCSAVLLATVCLEAFGVLQPLLRPAYGGPVAATTSAVSANGGHPPRCSAGCEAVGTCREAGPDTSECNCPIGWKGMHSCHRPMQPFGRVRASTNCRKATQAAIPALRAHMHVQGLIVRRCTCRHADSAMLPELLFCIFMWVLLGTFFSSTIARE